MGKMETGCNREMWQKIRQFDYETGKNGNMFLFMGNSIYFILALCGDYEIPIYLVNLSAAAAIVFLFQYLVRFIRWEGENLCTMYEKICYFPVDRKRYLLAKAVPAGRILALEIAIQWMAFLCRVLMQQRIAWETMVLVSGCTAISGICFFLGFLGLLAAGERAMHLIPILFGVGIMVAHAIANAVTGQRPLWP